MALVWGSGGYNGDDYIKTTYGGHYFQEGDYLQIVLRKLDDYIYRHFKECQKQESLLQKQIDELKDKIEVLAKNQKQRFRWVESHWELVDDE